MKVVGNVVYELSHKLKLLKHEVSDTELQKSIEMKKEDMVSHRGKNFDKYV